MPLLDYNSPFSPTPSRPDPVLQAVQQIAQNQIHRSQLEQQRAEQERQQARFEAQQRQEAERARLEQARLDLATNKDAENKRQQAITALRSAKNLPEARRIAEMYGLSEYHDPGIPSPIPMPQSAPPMASALRPSATPPPAPETTPQGTSVEPGPFDAESTAIPSVPGLLPVAATAAAMANRPETATTKPPSSSPASVPPGELAGALQDRISPASGRLLSATPVVVPSPIPTTMGSRNYRFVGMGPNGAPISYTYNQADIDAENKAKRDEAVAALNRVYQARLNAKITHDQNGTPIPPDQQNEPSLSAIQRAALRRAYEDISSRAGEFDAKNVGAELDKVFQYYNTQENENIRAQIRANEQRAKGEEKGDLDATKEVGTAVKDYSAKNLNKELQQIGEAIRRYDSSVEGIINAKSVPEQMRMRLSAAFNFSKQLDPGKTSDKDLIQALAATGDLWDRITTMGEREFLGTVSDADKKSLLAVSERGMAQYRERAIRYAAGFARRFNPRSWEYRNAPEQVNSHYNSDLAVLGITHQQVKKFLRSLPKEVDVADRGEDDQSGDSEIRVKGSTPPASSAAQMDPYKPWTP